ncbi:MAG: hypothetical protein ACE5DR_05045 [Thermodesulfobacteriota bacterium]
MLYDIIKAAKGEEHAFLREHLEYGLPEEAAVAKALKGGGWDAISVPNGALKRWLPMMALSIYVTGDKFLNGLAERINTFYNTNYYSDDNREPSYRHLLAACREGFRQETANKIKDLAAAEAAEKDLDLSLLSPLISLFGYDELKKTHERERGEFKKVIAARDKHIKGLKETLEKRNKRLKRLDSLENSNGVKVLKSLGLTKKPQ